MTLDTARRIFARGGRDIDDEIKRASDKEARFQAYSLQQSLSVSLDSSIRKLTSHNVLALLEGSSRKVCACCVPRVRVSCAGGW